MKARIRGKVKMSNMKIGTDMKYNYIVLAIAALFLCSCMGEKVETLENEGEQITVRAFQEGAPETRTTLIDGGTQVYWEPSDEIKLFFRGSGSRFLSQNTENVRSADFTGSLNIVAGHNEGASGSNTLWGLYPYRADATSDGVSVTTTLPAEQTGRAGSFAKNTHITLAQSNNFDLAFYNVCGGVRFSLTQEGIKRVTFEGNNGEALGGKIKLAFEDGIPTVKEISDTSKVITLSAPYGGTFQTGQWYYIEALPGALSGGYKMVFYKESESAKLTSSSSVTFRRGVFGSLADADEDLIFKPTGGDEPNPDDVIQFADPIAKYACVEKFDTDGDGEVSYAEAASATSLSGLFDNWNTVTSFDEIHYFTGVTSTTGVFTGCSKLNHITIPEWITTLGNFEGCSSLEIVALPESLSLLPASCFSGCTSLKDVTLPASITSIPDNCFFGCAALTTVSLPSTVSSLGNNAFAGCIKLAELDLPSGLKTIGVSAFINCQSIASVVFPPSLKSIGGSAFGSCVSLTSISLGAGVSLGGYAFYECSNLTSVKLPDDLISIPEYCFTRCDALSTIVWPQALTTIGDGAFVGCRFKDADYSLELPSSVTTIGNKAFGYLRHLSIPSTNIVNISNNSFALGYTFIYVPSNLVDMYKVRTNWSNYADRIKPIDNYPNEDMGEAVDLGLSVKWASYNVGASSPDDYGWYFAWGETEPGLGKVFTWYTYPWRIDDNGAFIKYNLSDNKTTIELDDDAAHVNWGGSWRMPTQTEYKELFNNCTSVWTTENGVNGYRFTSQKEGYTDKSIFIPAAGNHRDNWGYELGSSCYYWTSSRYVDYPYSVSHAYTMDGQKYGFGINYIDRFYGYSVRPVCP